MKYKQISTSFQWVAIRFHLNVNGFQSNPNTSMNLDQMLFEVLFMCFQLYQIKVTSFELQLKLFEVRHNMFVVNMQSSCNSLTIRLSVIEIHSNPRGLLLSKWIAKTYSSEHTPGFCLRAFCGFHRVTKDVAQGWPKWLMQYGLHLDSPPKPGNAGHQPGLKASILYKVRTRSLGWPRIHDYHRTVFGTGPTAIVVWGKVYDTQCI